MTLEDFLKIQIQGKHKHKWRAYNGNYFNYKCLKCDEYAQLAYASSTCISDDEAVIKRLLE